MNGSYIGDVYTGNTYPPFTGRVIPEVFIDGGSPRNLLKAAKRRAEAGTSRIQPPTRRI